MRIGTVSGLWRFPVKSMAGERCESVVLTQRGIPGDRGWAVHDESRNGITSAKRLPLLRACHAQYPDEPVAGAAPPPAEVILPDGRRVRTDTPAAASALAQLLGRAVTFCALGPAGSEAPPRLTSAGESPESFREMMGLLPGEPAPDLSAFSSDQLSALRDGNFFDAFPLHLLTRTTLRTLAHLAPESLWDERRFRANLLVEADDPEGFPELGWIDRQIQVGGAVIEIVMGCPRCVVVTQSAEGIPQDHCIMRTLVRETKHTAGVYARVIQEGIVRVGDAVEIAIAIAK